MLLFLAKVLIAGGFDQHHNASNTVEIIDLINPAFRRKWNNERAARAGPMGGILQNQPLIFGGHDGNMRNINNGIILRTNEELTLIEGRIFASSIVLNETRLWVCGGIERHIMNRLNSSEFISLDQPPEDGPKLPFTVSHHCMVQVDSKSIYLIGGRQNTRFSESKNTWIIDPTNNFAIKKGPKMIYARDEHSCATMRLNNKTFIVVFGGCYGPDKAKPEILDTSLPSNDWKRGK